MDCSVYTWEPCHVGRLDQESKAEVNWLAEKECLIEPLLDPRRDYFKFNSNNGYVGDGAVIAQQNSADVDQLVHSHQGHLHKPALPAMDEGEEDEDQEEHKNTTVAWVYRNMILKELHFFPNDPMFQSWL